MTFTSLSRKTGAGKRAAMIGGTATPVQPAMMRALSVRPAANSTVAGHAHADAAHRRERPVAEQFAPRCA